MYGELRLQEVARKCKNFLPDLRMISTVCADSRKCEESSLFVALKGEKTDGHKHLEEAKSRGAIAAIISEEYLGDSYGLKLIRVKDPLLALQDLARSIIEEYEPLIIGITGSVGKTTTKEFLFELIKGKFKVSKTIDSYNGQIGLPLSILNAQEGSDVFVLEMGISCPEEMQKLVSIAPPHIAVIGKIAEVHLGYYDSIEHLAAEKMKILDSKYLRAGFIHAANAPFFKLIQNPAFKKYTFGSEEADFSLQRDKGDLFIMDAGKGEKHLVKPPFYETHLLENFLVSAVLARHLNIPFAEINAKAMFLKPFKHRFEKMYWKDVLYIDDAYNCNPMNLEVGLKNIPRPKKGNKVIAVIGEMRELGKLSESAHRELGEKAADYVDELYCFGKESLPFYEAFKNKKPKAFHFSEKKKISEEVKALAKPGDVVYIKGANLNALWEVLEMIKESV